MTRSSAWTLGAAAMAIALAAPASAEIVDNSFFIEEAYNQERGIVQHIQTVHWTWDRASGSTARSISYALTQEWPVSGQRHQASFTLPYERRFGAQPSASGWGDLQIHYRAQVLEERGARPAFSPRLTLILPTGDADEGLGAGTTGFQVNLPLSKRLDGMHVHVNVGATVVPGARATLVTGDKSPKHDLLATNLGFSVIGLVSDRFHLLLEATSAVEEEIDGLGEKAETARILVSPGFRFGIDRSDGGQWVFGVGSPIGLSDSEDDFGLLLYTSFEHPF